MIGVILLSLYVYHRATKVQMAVGHRLQGSMTDLYFAVNSPADTRRLLER